MKKKTYRLSDFHYHLPGHLIAKDPASPRDTSRLLVVDTLRKTIKHHRFLHIDTFLPKNTLLCINNTKVLHAHLKAQRIRDRRLFDFLLLSRKEKDKRLWNVLVSPLKRIKAGDVFQTKHFSFTYFGREDDEGVIAFENPEDPYSAMDRDGFAPLPPYIARKTTKKDSRTYQTIYAQHKGSSAAPTAGLHFTDRIFNKLLKKNIRTQQLTLHVGRGTFSPVREEKIEDHRMHSEWYRVSPETAEVLNHQKSAGRCITAVGTTSVRTLETVYDRRKKQFRSQSGETSLYIYPPQKIYGCDHLITNFHLPRSSLLMLVCAFGGYDLIMDAYREAVKENYRFYSYGDAMLILR